MADEKYRILKDYFGYTRFRPGQEEVIDAVLAGRNVLAVMPTGAGKSLCYQIPALILPGMTVVISPLISLMKDQVNALRDAGVPAAFLNSSLEPAEYGEVMDRIHRQEVKILYMAPERLQRGDLAQFAGIAPVPLVVVDEAHCVSQWGHDFRPSYLQIAAFIAGLGSRPLAAAFTATATPRVREDILRLLGLGETEAPEESGPAEETEETETCRGLFTITTGFDRPNLYFEVQKPADRRAALLDCLGKRKDKSGIVYCSTRKAVEEVYELLLRKGFAAVRYHAGLESRERRENQDLFLYDRKTVMVATNAFGMGIDKSNVSFVIHYNMPKNIESYYQEAGRAGRDGTPADCILLYSGADVRINEFLITHRNEDEEGEKDEAIIEHNLELLKQMTFYAAGNGCLRQRILGYFGEESPAYCGNCSNCLTKFEETDIALEARKIISCIYRLKERGRSFGKTMIIDILRGSKAEKIRSQKLDTLSTWGIMADTGVRRGRLILDFLIQERYLVLTGNEYPVVELEPRAMEFIREKRPLVMMLPPDTRPQDGPSSAGKEDAEKAPVLSFDETLFASLRELRKEIASKAGVPAYIVFSDASLRDMCRKMPVSPETFSAVTGVGAVKSEKYGPLFTGLIREYTEEKGRSL